MRAVTEPQSRLGSHHRTGHASLLPGHNGSDAALHLRKSVIPLQVSPALEAKSVPYTILVVEPDPASQLELKQVVVGCGYHVRCAPGADEAFAEVMQSNPALVLLELMLADMDGLDLCRLLRRQSTIPIIVVTLRTSEVDRICAFELGADDYVCKPFRPVELAWRMKALVRTTYSNSAGSRHSPSLQFGSLEIRPDTREVTVAGQAVHLTPKEFDLLLALAQNHERVVSSEWLLLNVWGYDDSIRTRTLDVHINRLRSKIEPDSSGPRFIQTVCGVGYSFNMVA